MITDDVDEEIRHLTVLSQSSNTLLAEQAQQSIDRLVKVAFDPSELRGPGGKWTTGGAGSGAGKPPKKKPATGGAAGSAKPLPAVAAGPKAPHPTTAAPPPPKATSGGSHGAKKKPKKKTGSSKAGRAEVASLRASLGKVPKASAPTTLERDAAVTAMQAKYGIPTGKALSALPVQRRDGASQMASATRTLLGLKARQSAATAAVDAIKKAQSKAKSAEAKKFLASKLAAAQTKLAAAKASMATANRTFQAGLDAWQG